MDEDLIFKVLAIVSEIPQGKVASYKQIAILAGHPQNARLGSLCQSVNGSVCFPSILFYYKCL